MRSRSVGLSVLAIGIAAVFTLGCAPTSPTDQSTPRLPSPEPVATPTASPPSSAAQPAARVETCAAVATLYPKGHLADDSTRRALIGRTWANRDGGRGSMHGPPMKWRRSTDLRFEEKGGELLVSYDETFESTGEEPKTESWTKTCEVCGQVMVCAHEVFALSVHELEDEGQPLRAVNTTPILSVGDHDLYLVRYAHEIHLSFGANPRTTESGPLGVAVRKLEAGAEPRRKTTTFTSEPIVGDSSARTVRIDLPDDVGTIIVEYRPDQPPATGGSGKSKALRESLIDLETLKLHPKRMTQPSSLEIEPGEEASFRKPRH